MKKIICVVLFLIFGLLVRIHRVSADFEISEFMYDQQGTDAGREWVEVKNTATKPADLSKWFFFAGNTKHALVAQTSSTVDAKGYAVIVQDLLKFKNDFPNFNGLLFDSSWSGLNNEGGTIALKDPNLDTVSSVSYLSGMGGSGNGDSLQNINGTFVGAHPTPGEINVASPTTQNNPDPTTTSNPVVVPEPTENQNQSVSDPDAAMSASSATQTTLPATTKVTIHSENQAFVGIPLMLDTTISGTSTELSPNGKFLWNFGDGVTKEENGSTPFSYTYHYAGEYALSLSYYSNTNDRNPTATYQKTIKVVLINISISSVGDSSDPFIELENNSSYEIPLSGFVLEGARHTFTIPENTMLLPLKKLKLASLLTLFSVTDTTNIILQNPNGGMVSAYQPVGAKTPTQTTVSQTFPQSQSATTQTKATPKKKISKKPISKKAVSLPQDDTIDLTQVSNDIPPTANTPIPVVIQPKYVYIGIGVILVIGLLIRFVVNKKKKNKNTEDPEMEIIDEDMKILE